MTRTAGDRHLSWPNLVKYLEAGAPAIVRIAGTPTCDLVIEPAEQRIALRGPWPATADIPDLTGYRRLDTRSGTDGSGDWVEFAVTGWNILREAYPILVAVADRVQLQGEGMGRAIQEVLNSYRELLSSLGRLSEYQELGLYGELVVLKHLVRSAGEEEAVDSWKGPTREEHDFGLDRYDIEVKTTLSEDRSHRISSLTQLQWSPDRDLWLVSVQLTASGVGGTTLPQIIESVKDCLSAPLLRIRFADKLASHGWDSGHSHLYTRRFAARGGTLTFRITDDFPAITARHLQSIGLPIERFSRVSYILHTAGLPAQAPPEELEGLG